MVGECVLSWPLAYEAVREVATHFVCLQQHLQANCALIANMLQEDQAWARRQLDQALSLRGNVYFGAAGDCCVGCATWKRCFLLLPLWSMVLAAIGTTSALVPWAFAGSLHDINHGGKW